jgi:hypothetical protein
MTFCQKIRTFKCILSAKAIESIIFENIFLENWEKVLMERTLSLCTTLEVFTLASVAFDILICAKCHQPVLFHIATQTIPLQRKSLKNLCSHCQKASLKIVSMDSATHHSKLIITYQCTRRQRLVN